MRCHADFGGYMWHSASCKICKKYIFWVLSVKQNCAATRSSWCSYDTEVSRRLGRVQVAATLPTGPLCVQWRQQQLISGALFWCRRRKRDISSEERTLTGQNYLLKMKKHLCKVMCSALNGVNSWSTALFYMSASRKAVFSEKAHCQFHLICWRYITQSPSEVLISVG